MTERHSPPPGPPPSYDAQHATEAEQRPHVSFAQTGNRSSELASNNPFRTTHARSAQDQPQSNSDAPPEYEAPPGPPPTWGDKKQPLPNDEYEAPPGPPPSHRSREADPPPYDPWLAVPDNALLPPPPSIREETSPAANASYDDAARGHAWCRQNALWAPRRHGQQILSRITNGDIYLTTAPNTKHIQLSRTAHGRTHIGTGSKCTDTIFLSDVPLYPATTGRPRTIYFELRVISMGSGGSRGEEEADAGIAIGFLAPPYPAWRLPGWHRASLAVHGDDGRRYVDNSYGGQDFTAAFNKGDVVGIGMSFSPPRFVGGKNTCDVFFTRNGKKEGGWNLHEEKDRDQEEGDVFGLEGDHDLLAAVGCFGGVEFETRFGRDDWMFKP